MLDKILKTVSTQGVYLWKREILALKLTQSSFSQQLIGLWHFGLISLKASSEYIPSIKFHIENVIVARIIAYPRIQIFKKCLLSICICQLIGKYCTHTNKCSAGGLKICCRRGKTHPLPQKKVLAMTLNCIQHWSSNFGDLEYPFIVITLWYTLIQNSSTC